MRVRAIGLGVVRVPRSLPALDGVAYRLGSKEVVPFDPAAPYFAERIALDRLRLLDMLDLVRSHKRPPARVLELAAAPYIFTAALLTNGYDVSVTGLPFGAGPEGGTAVFAIGGERYESPLALFDVEEAFPFPDESFDIVVAGEILEHLYRRPWSLLAEAWRCLRPGGILLLSTPNAERLELLYAWLRRLPSSQGFNPDAPSARHAREYGPAEIEALLRSQGFESISVGTPGYARIRDGFPGRLGWLKRRVHAWLKRRAAAAAGPLGMRGDTIIAAAVKDSSAPPGRPPEFMVYGIGDARSGHNFPDGVSRESGGCS